MVSTSYGTKFAYAFDHREEGNTEISMPEFSEFSIVKLSDVASPKTPGPDDLAVDPNNPNLTAVQTDDGLLLPAVRMDDAEASIKDGTSNTVFFSERYGSPDGEYVLTGIEHGADDSQASHPGGANMLFGDGSVRSTDTSAVATLLDFEWSSSDTTDRLVVVTDADPAGAIAGVIIAATTDNNRIDDGADYSGSHALYQDVFIPTLDTGTLIIAHEGYWY